MIFFIGVSPLSGIIGSGGNGQIFAASHQIKRLYAVAAIHTTRTDFAQDRSQRFWLGLQPPDLQALIPFRSPLRRLGRALMRLCDPRIIERDATDAHHRRPLRASSGCDDVDASP